MTAQDDLFHQLFNEDDISWRSMIMEAVKSHEMDPWDIDISFIASEFIKKLTELKELNFKISGKVVLASALLLKLKSLRFVNEDMTIIEQLINASEYEESFADEDDATPYAHINLDGEEITLNKRTPQPRKRKVSIYDLIDALEQALEVNRRRNVRHSFSAEDVQIPEKKFDIISSMDELYDDIVSRQAVRLAFSALIPSQNKEDQVFTFIPLLHLRNANKIDLHQDAPFSDFHISVNK